MPSFLSPPAVLRSHHQQELQLEPERVLELEPQLGREAHQEWQRHKMFLQGSPVAQARQDVCERIELQDQQHFSRWQQQQQQQEWPQHQAKASTTWQSPDSGHFNKLRKKKRGSAPAHLASQVYYEGTFASANLSKPKTMSATTVTVHPIHQLPLEAARPPSIQAPHYASPHGGRRESISTPRISMPPGGYSTYPMYSGLQTSSSPRARYRESAPIPLNTPRKLSNSQVTSAAALPQQALMDSKMLVHSMATNVEPVNYHAMMPAYSKPRHTRHMSVGPMRRIARKPNELFASLPNEVLELILEQLRQLHLGTGSTSCATCWMRDLCNVCLASQRWAQFARAALYGDIQLVGPDSAAHRKRFKLSQGARILMLRRTLRSKPQVAALVRRLKVPCLELLDNGSVPKGALSPEQYDDLTATLLMACPNLEKFTGPTPPYSHSFSKLFHALSTRTDLKEMDWLIQPLAVEAQRRQPSSPSRPNTAVIPSGLDPHYGDMFLDLHANWTSLKSLTIHCLPGATLAPNGLFTKLLRRLPCLQHLHLCNLPVDAFNDHNLLSLPPLQTLSLSHISGITASGLSSFATRKNSHTLRNLHFRHTPLSSLPALARIFSNLPRLTNFSLVQAYPPVMPESDSFTLVMMPYLASPSVSKLHWDITSLSDRAKPCDNILARSIAAGGFPRLRKLRTPNDPEGVFQALCRPVDRIDFASDRFRRSNGAYPTYSPLSTTDQRKTLVNGLAPHSSQALRPPWCTDLCIARLAAQARLEQAREQPKFNVSVTTEEGEIEAIFQVGGFMGTVGSQIEYFLRPDVGSSDEKGGLVDMRDLGADNGESLSGGKEGCMGRWNMTEGVVADKKEKESWWHTERGRWKGLELH